MPSRFTFGAVVNEADRPGSDAWRPCTVGGGEDMTRGRKAVLAIVAVWILALAILRAAETGNSPTDYPPPMRHPGTGQR